MIPYLLESSLCILAFSLFYYLALHGKSFYKWNRYYILTTLILSLLIPLLHIPLEEVIYVQQSQFTSTANPTARAGFTFTWQHGLLMIYVIGLCGSLSMFLKEVLQIRRLIRLADLKEYRNYVLAQVPVSFPLCSFFKYIIVEKDQPISEYELNHELGHIQQKHSYDKVFVEIMKGLFWFHPSIYFFRTQLHANHEYLADELVVNTYGVNAYLDFLVKSVLSQQQSFSTVNPFHSLIKNRLHMLNNKKESTKSVFFMLIPVLFFLSFFIACEETTKIVPVDNSSDYQNLEFNELGEVVVSDTIVVFDDETFEEEEIIVSSSFPLEEYQNRLTKDGRVHKNYDEALVTVTDTIITFNIDTGEESVKLVTGKIPFADYLQREREMKEQAEE